MKAIPRKDLKYVAIGFCGLVAGGVFGGVKQHDFLHQPLLWLALIFILIVAARFMRYGLED